MKIFISKTYQKWTKANKGDPAILAVEKFLFRVFNSDDITNVTPQPKSVGGNLRKIPGVVDEFTLNRKYRIYSKCLETKPGVVAFYLAVGGSKGVTDQNEDILKALSIFDDITTMDWGKWKPTPEQIKEFSEPEPKVIATNPQALAPTPKPVSKKKGKPVDENGLTPKERKALRRQQEQEEQRKLQQQKAEKIKLQKEQEEAQRRAAAVANQAKPESAVADTNTIKDVPSVIPEPVTPKVEADKPAVTLNGAQIPAPEMPVGDVTFQDVAHVQYELELIEHQIKIEQLQMEIVRQNIAMAQHEIALEQLKIKQLKLLQMQKTQNMQK